MVLPIRDGAERRVYGKIARAAFAARAATRAKRPGVTIMDDNYKEQVAETKLPRRVEPIIAVPPSLITAAEMKEAPVLFAELTEDGITVLQAVHRYQWNDDTLKHLALTYGRVLQLLPEGRSDQVWATIVCQLTACFFADLCPVFNQVQKHSAEMNLGYFSYVPRKGKYGWRNRARWYGLL